MYLNVEAKTIKLLEGNIRTNFHDLELGNGILDMTPKAQVTDKEVNSALKIKDFVLHKTKNVKI